MNRTVRRAGAFALVGSLVLAVPVLGRLAVAIPAVVLAFTAAVDEGPLFELFARPGDREEDRLYGLIGFTLAATGLGILGFIAELSLGVFVGTVLLLVWGNLTSEAVKQRYPDPFAASAGFAAGGSVAFVPGAAFTLFREGASVRDALPELAFLAVAGAVLGALVRAALFERDDPLVLWSVALTLWFLEDLVANPDGGEVALAVGVTVAFGYVSYYLETASVPGMLTGVLLGLLTIVLGGLEWFAILIAFYGVGGLSTKFRYEEKAARGVAEDNEGARGSGNVLGNSAVALAAVVGYAAVGPGYVPLAEDVYLFAFVGSLATAMSDTLSSEIGAVYDDPRLVTTFERVDPGTDGAVTWQGELAGFVGAALVAAAAYALFPAVGVAGAGVVFAAGVAGMTADSVLGATIEDAFVGNQGVNFLATLVGALVGGALAVLVLDVALALS
ncbi:DUF92 domain-containing protein [Halorubellus sp. PRR65]|uniref:DUF92 domain-containing protein n=1 Tax=Halorubellus sp. PRR65 TaxID=3098148 RepID=UPI002B261764|nr:DUF92 domain-containing protein [Halorubellus sp. PRR65]